MIEIFSRFKADSKAIAEECTASPVFHFQRKMYVLHDLPEWIGEGSEGGFEVEVEKVKSLGYGDLLDSEGEAIESKIWQWLSDNETADGYAYVTEYWETVRTFIDQPEATAYGEKWAYNYPLGWRVYAQPAEGELATLLKMVRGGYKAPDMLAVYDDCLEFLRLAADFVASCGLGGQWVGTRGNAFVKYWMQDGRQRSQVVDQAEYNETLRKWQNGHMYAFLQNRITKIRDLRPAKALGEENEP